MTATTPGRARRVRPVAAQPSGHASLAYPSRDDVESFLAAEIVERCVISTRQHVQSAVLRSFRVQLRASHRIDEPVLVSSELEENNGEGNRPSASIIRGRT